MVRDQLRSSLIVRVRTTEAGPRILVHNLHTQEALEFTSWAAFTRYLRLSSRTGRLR